MARRRHELVRYRRLKRRLGRTVAWASGLTLLLPFAAIMTANMAGWMPWFKLYGLIAFLSSLVIAPLMALVAGGLHWFSKPTPATVTVEDDDIVVERGASTHRIARDEIDGGVMLPADGSLEIRLRGGDVLQAALSDRAAAAALMDDLDVGPRERRVGVTLADPRRAAAGMVLRGIGVILLGVMVLGQLAGSFKSAGGTMPVWVVWPWLAVMIASLLAWGRFARPPEVIVGADGVRIVKGGRDQYVPYRDIERVYVVERALVIQVRGGERLVARGDRGSEPQLKAVVHRIEDAMNAPIEEPNEALAARFEKGPRSIEEWRDALVRMLAGRDGYRGNAIARDLATQILEDPAGAPERRIGAALALASDTAPEARRRIRIAADRATSDELRIALEQAAEGDLEEEALAAALKDRHT